MLKYHSTFVSHFDRHYLKALVNINIIGDVIENEHELGIAYNIVNADTDYEYATVVLDLC